MLEQGSIIIAALVWVIASALTILAWTAWLYLVPATYACMWGVNPQGAAHFAAVFSVLGIKPAAITADAFRLGFRILLGAAFLSYGGMLANGLAGRPPSKRFVAWVAAVVAAVLAVAGPPALSSDIYAYVGYARLQLFHHANPYETTQLALGALHDPTAPFLRWPISSPYGPLWTLISMGAVAVFPRTVIWGPVVLLKLINAAAVLWMAEVGRRLSEKVAPGRGPTVFAALALNPLFLMEGVVNGHNDVVMAALVLWALLAAAERRFTLSFLLLGLSVAVKFFPLLLAPWLLVGALRAAPTRRLAVAARSTLLAVAPVLLCFAVFWRGPRTLAGLATRPALGYGMAGGHVARDLGALALIYLAVSWWAVRGDDKRLVTGWALASLAVGAFASGISFPWYVTWPLGAALVRLDRGGLALSAVVGGYGVAKLLQYA